MFPLTGLSSGLFNSNIAGLNSFSNIGFNSNISGLNIFGNNNNTQQSSNNSVESTLLLLLIGLLSQGINKTNVESNIDKVATDEPSSSSSSSSSDDVVVEDEVVEEEVTEDNFVEVKGIKIPKEEYEKQQEEIRIIKIIEDYNRTRPEPSPLAFDTNGDGIKTSNNKIDFDIDGDGKKDKINDVLDPILSFKGGKDGKDLFGDNTDLDGDGKADGYKDGFDALKKLAEKEGLINGKDDMKLDANDIKKLEDKYNFGMKTKGYNSQAQSLASLGITEINLDKSDKVKETKNFDGKGNILTEQDGATFLVNGKEQKYADVWHVFTK